MNIIVNATPLISLAVINHLHLLEQIFEKAYIPHAVYNEVIAQGKNKAGYTQLLQMKDFIVVEPINTALKQSIMLQLDEGEAEVITIAKDMNMPLVCIDEFAGRKYANLLGLEVVGTLGILLIAKKRGFIPIIKPLCDQLIQHDRYISRELYNSILNKANE